MIHLIKNEKISDHVSEDTVKELEKVILSDPQVKSANGARGAARFLGSFVWRLYEYVESKKNSFACNYLSFPLKGDYFSVLMGLRFRKCMPYFTFSKRKYLYIFDAWPQYHDKIIEFAKLYKVNSLFVTSRQVAERLQESSRCPVDWIPEGIEPTSYRYYNYQEKNIDVLEFGRKHLPYHKDICGALAKMGKVHLYEQEKGNLIFPTRESFIDGLAHAKISICIPSNITHAERAGNIETMTIRYLQSMVSKCLIVGHAPTEMVDIFGYNPVLEIDPQNPVQQLNHVLSLYDDFIPMIERNYNEVLAHHTWTMRWAEITHLLTEYRLFPDSAVF